MSNLGTEVDKEYYYVSKKDQSNKMWSYKFLTPTSVEIRYGRIGGSISTQSKSFGSEYQAQNFVTKKLLDKTSPKKGYVLTEQDDYESEKETAEDLGQQYKITDTKWVKMTGKKLEELPAYDEEHLVYVGVLNSWSKVEYHYLLGKSESFKINDLTKNLKFSSVQKVYDRRVGAVRRFIKRLADSVVEYLATVKVGQVGRRSLDLGLGEELQEDTGFQAPKAEITSKIKGSSAVSVKCLSTFATLGTRSLILDL